MITAAQLDEDGKPINDCLGNPNGSVVDNIEDVDIVVGWLAETTRPHGFAISETQFQIFILNASRRLSSATASSPRASGPSSTPSSASTG